MTGIDRIAAAFAYRPALVTYVMGGDPNPRKSIAAALACAEGGADILEIGVPFSDPIADGPTIQRASERALAAGTNPKKVIDIAREVRRHTEVPIVLMGYLNPLAAYGFDRLAASGIDGVIIPDLPPEESGAWCSAARQRGVATVFLLAPTSTQARRAAVFERASGFVYFVSVTGVTGARRALPKELGAQLDAVRAESPVPVVVGFGVAEPKQVSQLGKHADGVVVGSAIVSRIAQGKDVRPFVRSLRRAADPRPAR